MIRKRKLPWLHNGNLSQVYLLGNFICVIRTYLEQCVTNDSREILCLRFYLERIESR